MPVVPAAQPGVQAQPTSFGSLSKNVSRKQNRIASPYAALEEDTGQSRVQLLSQDSAWQSSDIGGLNSSI